MEDTTSHGGTFQDTKIRAFNRGCQGTWRDIRNEHSPGYEDWGFELAVDNEPEAVNIQPGQLRNRLGELPRDKEINVFCCSAQRSYCARRILLQNRFKAKNISGGMLRRNGSVVLIAAMALPKVDPGLICEHYSTSFVRHQSRQ